MFLFLVAALGICLDFGVSQAPRTFPLGQLVENVQSDAAPGQRFTLYIPTSYNPAKPAPVLYLMDPRSRARVPAKLFLPAAERFGYILISSHNTSSDGPMEPNLDAMQAMWVDTHDWFAVDDRRVYVAGFSGTARTASLLARNKPDSITGFIGAGAGFHPAAAPSKDVKTLYFGTVGDVDYNFHEMEALEESLVSLDVAHRIERFSGPHSWMTPELAAQAIEWMELRAMQSGSRPRDEALIDAWWARDLAVAQQCIDAGRPLAAARRYAAMTRDYRGLRDTAAVSVDAARLSSTSEASRELKRRQAESKKSNLWVANAMQAIAEAFPDGAGSPATPAAELARLLEIAHLKKIAAGPDPEAALEARRRLNQVEVQLGFYLPQEAIDRAQLERAAYYLSLALQIDDASPVSWYLVAETRARMNAPKEAFAALERAVNAGFRDLPSLEADPAFRRLRTDARYTAIVDSLRSSGDILDPLAVDRPPVRVPR